VNQASAKTESDFSIEKYGERTAEKVECDEQLLAEYAFGLIFAPRVTRFFAGILASVTASDFLQRAYLAAKEKT